MSPNAVVVVVLTAAAFPPYLSHDGALMLADPALGGNAACEPATITWQAPKRRASQDQPAPEGS